MILRTKKHLIVFAAVLCFSGCTGWNAQQPLREDGGQKTAGSGFQEQWRNSYERGRWYSDKGQYREALAEFRKAIEIQSQDQRKVETGGTLAADYFPHRESGVVHFRRKYYDQAIEELQTSVQSAPSARAYYFLNEARSRKLRMEERDLAPPEIHLEGSTGRQVTNSFTLAVKGVATDDSFVAAIEVGGRQIPLELVEKQKVFTTDIQLDEGENVIEIKATDLAGKTSRQNLEVLNDRTGPLVEILRVESENGENRMVHGVVSDGGGLQSLTINGDPWKITGKHPAYNFRIALLREGLTILATDRAGNVTAATITANEPEKDPLLAPRGGNSAGSSMFSLSPIVIAERRDSQESTSDQSSPDTAPPAISLEGLGPVNETHEDFTLLKVTITDASPVSTILINEKTITTKNGMNIFLSQREPLSSGKNEFTLAAEDIHGNRSEKTITVDRKTRNIHRADSRMSLAILPFARERGSAPPPETLQEMMAASFGKQQRFNIIEPQEIAPLLQGLNLDPGDLADPTRAADAGRMIGADAVLNGSFHASGNEIELSGRLVETVTGSVLAFNDIFGETKDDSSPAELFDSLAEKFRQDLPVLEGILTEIDESGVTIDLGSNKHIRPGMHLLCYRQGLEIRHPVTGRIMGAEPEILGELIVREVHAYHSIATPHRQQGTLQVFDRVITK